MNFNLDEGISLSGLLGLNSPAKILSIGQRIAVKHYCMFDFCYAFILDIDNNYLRLKFRSSLPELDFFPEDPIVLNFALDEKVYIASGEIVSVESLDPLTIEVKVINIEKRDTQRKSERFYVSLSCTLLNQSEEEPIFAIVKNLSFSGFKVNSKKDLAPQSPVEINISIDKYYNISCSGKIVRKNKLSVFYEYGIEISDISKTNMLTLQHYINTIKSGN